MVNGRSAGSAWTARIAMGTAGAAAGVIPVAWSLLAGSVTGGQATPAPLPLIVLCLGIAAGIGRRRGGSSPSWSGAGGWVLPVGPLLSAVLCLLLPPILISIDPLQAGPSAWRLIGTMLAVGPLGLALGLGFLWRRETSLAWFWTGSAVGVLSVRFAAEQGRLPGAVILFAALFSVTLLVEKWRRGSNTGRDDAMPPASTPAALHMLTTGLFVVTWLAWMRFLLLICGPGLAVREALLVSLVAGLAAGTLVSGWRMPPGERPFVVGLCFLLLAAVVVTLTGLSEGLATWWLILAALPEAPGAAAAAWCLGLISLGSMAFLAALGSGWMGSRPVSISAVRTVAGTAVVAVVLVETLLLPLLGPGRLLLFASAALPLGAALPLFLGAGGPLGSRSRLGGVAASVVLALGGLMVAAPARALLAAGLAWRAPRHLFHGRPSLPDRLGRTRVTGWAPSGAGLVAVRQESGHPEELTWQGATAVTLDDTGRARQAFLGTLPLLLHPSPADVLVVGDPTGAIADAIRTTVKDVHLTVLSDGTGLAIPGESSPQEGRGWSRARHDVIILHPLAPRVSGTGSVWTVERLAALRNRLRPEQGVLLLGLDVARETAAGFQREIASFVRIFPHASLWFDGQGLVLIGPTRPPVLDLATFERRFRAAGKSLHSLGLDRPVDLMGTLVMADQALSALAARAEPEHLGRPRLVLEPAPVSATGGGISLLSRLVVAPGPLVDFFPDLDAAGRRGLRDRLTVPSAVTAHLLSAIGLASSDPARAQEHARQAFELRRDDVLARRQLARVTFDAALASVAANNIGQAIDAAEQAVRLDPDRLDPHLLLFDLMSRQGRHKVADRRLDLMAVRFPDRYPVLLLLAQRRFDQKDANAARALLRRAADLGYETADLDLGLARDAYARGMPADGRRWVARAVRRGPDPGAVLAYAGGRLMKDGRPGDAEMYLKRALLLGDDAAEVVVGLGEIALERQEYIRARDYFLRAVRQAPDEVRVRLDLGSTLLLLDEPEEAATHLRVAAARAPDNPMVLLNLAVALSRTGDRAEARRQLTRIGDRLADNPIFARLVRDLQEPTDSPE
ncbi:MAG: tetratricopeptide repeat protein [Acidobacteriota bacterium]